MAAPCRPGRRRAGRGCARRGCCAGSPTYRPRSSWPSNAGRRRGRGPWRPHQTEAVGPPHGVVVADEGVGTEEIGAELEDALVDLGEHQLGDRALGPGVTGLAVLGRPHVGQPEDLRLDPEAHQAVPLDRAPRAAPVLEEPHRLGDRPRATRRGRRAADGGALVGQGGHGHPPALADLPDPVGVGYPDLGQEDLVELGNAGYLAEWSHLDPGCVHVECEVGEATMLRDRGIGPRHQHPAIGDVGERVPDLLPGDHPFVAVTDGHRGESGEIGARTRLAEQLAPGVLAGEGSPEEARP